MLTSWVLVNQYKPMGKEHPFRLCTGLHQVVPKRDCESIQHENSAHSEEQAQNTGHVLVLQIQPMGICWFALVMLNLRGPISLSRVSRLNLIPWPITFFDEKTYPGTRDLVDSG